MLDQKKRHLLKFVLKESCSPALIFGDFTLKSGRKSPYFFQSNAFSNGKILYEVGCSLADAIAAQTVVFDGLFGPPYKGIPLVSATAIALNINHNINKPYSFSRKSEKTYGDKSDLCGAPLKGKIWIIDDVLTAGTAVTATIEFLHSRDATTAGVLTLIDRCESDNSGQSTKTALSQRYGIPIISVLTMHDVCEFLIENDRLTEAKSIVSHLKNNTKH